MANAAKCAVITGASAGIGRAFAERLAATGATTILVARSEDKLSALAEELEHKFGVRSYALPADLTDPAAIDGLLTRIESLGARPVDLLINNAGFGSAGRFVDIPIERELSLIQLNVQALTALTHLFGKAFEAGGGGTIVNVSSVLASFPVPKSAVYAASKAYVSSFTQAVAAEMDGSGVEVVLLCPGATRTNFNTVSGYDEEMPSFVTQTPEQVVSACLQGLRRGKRVITPGAHNKASRVMGKVVPTGVLTSIGKKFFPSHNRVEGSVDKAEEL